jgi:hypothetical protein
MKKKLTLLTTLFVLALGCSVQSPASMQGKKPESRATPAPTETPAPAEPVMKSLRDKLLTSSPEVMGLKGKDAEAKVWGVLMEMAFPAGVATLVSVDDGTASIYTSTGGGVLGGYSARKEAKQFVAEAEKHLAGMKPTKSFPYPEVGRVRFYVLTREGVYSTEADEEELVSGQHALSPLYLAGNEVLAVLHTASDRAAKRWAGRNSKSTGQ